MLLLAALLLHSPQLPERHLVEELRITAPTPETEFLSISGVVEIDGSIYVSDPRAPAVYRFDAEGRWAGRVGGRGEGPGEYGAPDALGARSDSLWVYDARQRRILVFDPAGRPARTIVLLAPVSGVGVLLRDGSVAVIPGWTSARGRADAPPTLPVVRHGSGGAPRDTVLILPVERGQLRLDQPGGGMLVGPRPFDDSPILVGTADGAGFIRVDRLTTGPASFTVTRLGVNGRREWQRELPYAAAPVDRAIVDSVVGNYAHPPSPRTPAVPEAVVRAALEIPPRSVPVLQVIAGSDGTIWLRRPSPVGRSARFLVLTSDGTPSAELLLPPGGRLVAAAVGRIWVVQYDQEGSPFLVRYRVQ